jgi:hypothetical protein
VSPQNFYFGGGSGETVMHPAVALAMVLTIILILVLPRKKAITPFLLCAFLIPLGQTLVLGGVHLFVLRIVVISGCARMLFAKFSSQDNFLGGGFNAVDRVFILWAVFRAMAFLILFSFPSAAIVNQVAFLLDAMGGYFFLRFLIQDDEDILSAIKTLAIVAAIVGVCMVNEKLRSQNVYGYLGGFRIVPETRDGAIRAQGPFSHPILAGSFGATLLPLFFWLWKSGRGESDGRRRCDRVHLDGFVIGIEHPTDGLYGRYRCPLLLADAQTHARVSLGTPHRTGIAAYCDEGSSVVLDCSRGFDRSVIGLSPRGTRGSVHPALQSMVAGRN